MISTRELRVRLPSQSPEKTGINNLGLTNIALIGIEGQYLVTAQEGNTITWQGAGPVLRSLRWIGRVASTQPVSYALSCDMLLDRPG